MPLCQLCPAQFEPRAPKLKVCVRCEAFLTLCSLKSEALTMAQRALPFPLYPKRRRQTHARKIDSRAAGVERRAADLDAAGQAEQWPVVYRRSTS